jgi:uncharacterized coiled-coil DUF342 family protein
MQRDKLKKIKELEEKFDSTLKELVELRESGKLTSEKYQQILDKVVEFQTQMWTLIRELGKLND